MNFQTVLKNRTLNDGYFLYYCTAWFLNIFRYSFEVSPISRPWKVGKIINNLRWKKNVAKTTIMNIAMIIKIKIPVVFTLIILRLLSNKDLNNILSKYNLCSTNWKTSRTKISKLYKLSNILGLPFGNRTDSVCISRTSWIFYKKLIAIWSS